MSWMPTKLETHHCRMDNAFPVGGGTVYSKLSHREFAKIRGTGVYLSQKYDWNINIPSVWEKTVPRIMAWPC